MISSPFKPRFMSIFMNPSEKWSPLGNVNTLQLMKVDLLWRKSDIGFSIKCQFARNENDHLGHMFLLLFFLDFVKMFAGFNRFCSISIILIIFNR